MQKHGLDRRLALSVLTMPCVSQSPARVFAGLAVLIAVGVVLSVALSEIASNTAAANVTVPLMIAVAHGAGVDPVPVALACAFGCTFGFMLPVSSGPNTLAYATGEVRVRGMMRHGIALDLIGIVAIWLTIRFLTPLIDIAP